MIFFQRFKTSPSGHGWLTLSICLFFLTSCAGPRFNKGITESGEKVYVTALSENLESFKIYSSSRKKEIDKLNYLMNRLKEAKEVTFIRDGREYNWLQAYRGGNFMMRKYYKGGDAKKFVREHIWKSHVTGNPHLIRLPNGKTHIGYYVVLNELEALETM